MDAQAFLLQLDSNTLPAAAFNQRAPLLASTHSLRSHTDALVRFTDAAWVRVFNEDSLL